MNTWGVHIIFEFPADTKKEALQKARDFISVQPFGKATGLSISDHPLSEPQDEKDWTVIVKEKDNG